MDRKGVITSANPASFRLSGYSEDDLVGKHFSKIGANQARDIPKYLKIFVSILNDNLPEPFEVQLATKDDVPIWAEAHVGHLKANGKIVGVQVILRDITERKKIENELISSEERLKILFEYAPDAYYLNDLKGVFVDGNRAAEELTGYEKSELIGKNFLKIKLIPRRYISKAAKLLAINALGKPTGPDEFVLNRKDGVQVTVEIRTFPVTIEGRTLVLGIAHDITEHKRLDEKLKEHSERLEELVEEKVKELRESEVRFRELAELLPQTVFEIDLENNITFINHIGLESYGYTREDLKSGLDVLNLFIPEDRDRAEKNGLRMMNGDEVLNTEYTALRKNGSTFPVDIFAVPIIRDGNVRGFRGIAIDLTDRKKSEEEIRESEKKYRTLVELSPDGITTLNRWGTITSVNRAFEKLTDYSDEEIVGKHFTKIGTIRARDIPRYLKLFSDVLRGKDVPFIEFSYTQRDGTSRWAEAHVSIMRDNGKLTGIQAVLRDITDRKESEQTLKENQEKLKEYSDHLEELVEEKTKELKGAERMAAIGEIASMVGHDLRNPLTGIAGAIYYLKTKLDPKMDESMMKMLELAERNVEYSDKIINDLLDYSRKIFLEKTKTTPQSIMRAILSSIQIPKKIQVEDRTQREPMITIDTQKMKRIFTNIITNAMDAMPEGGKLTITSQELKDKVEFTFTDTGEGIPDEIKEKIWTPLFTTKAKGMGLGLAICKRMVEAHNGSISVESTVGKGSTFTITIPLKRE
ncbi:hypothetical protein DRO61_03090 [Candidatus Bathyarchaeota archaeon]|nr:MAG: hypothetical protein DRO61_03090 [Candidatus Bathyarchaeota archaeon]